MSNMVISGGISKNVMDWSWLKNLGKVVIGAGIDALKGVLSSQQGNDSIGGVNIGTGSGPSINNIGGALNPHIQGISLSNLLPKESKVDFNFKPFIPKQVKAKPPVYNFNTVDNQADNSFIASAQQQNQNIKQQQVKPPTERVIDTSQQKIYEEMARYAAHPRYNDYVNEYYAKNPESVTYPEIAGLQSLRRSVEAGAYARKIIDINRAEAWQYFQDKYKSGGSGSEPNTSQSDSNDLRESVKDVYDQAQGNHEYFNQKQMKKTNPGVWEAIFPRKTNIVRYKEFIKFTAKQNRIPPELIGGILYNEANNANKPLEWVKKKIGEFPTVGIAQVSPHSSLAEKTLGFDAKRNDYLVQKYSKLLESVGMPTSLNDILKFRDKNVIESLRTYRNIKIDELKKLVTKYYQGNADNKDVNLLREVFKGDKNITFITDKQRIKSQVNEEMQKLNNDQYSIEYLGKLTHRIANDKLYPEYNLSDDQMREIAKQYNNNKLIPTGIYYCDQFKDALPTVRSWLK